MSGPAWTRRVAGIDSHRGLWPLGIEPVGFNLAKYQLPGITNATQHIRYLSFFSWVFWKFEQVMRARGRTGWTRAEQEAWKIRMENAMRAATLYHDPTFVGALGITSGPRVAADPHEPFEIANSDAASAFVPAAYSSPWRNLGCGETSGELVRWTPQVGLPLALAFESQLASADSADLALLFSEQPTIPAGVIHRLVDRLHLRPVEPDEPEHAPLLDMLFRLGTESRNPQWRERERRRSVTLTLLLEIAEQADGTLANHADIHRTFASGLLPSGAPFQPPSELTASLRVWQRYEERSAQKFALYGLWAEVYAAIGAGLHSVSAIAGRILGDIERSILARSWFGAGGLDQTVAEARSILRETLQRKGLRAGLAIHDLMAIVESPAVPADRAAASAVLLLGIIELWRMRAATLPEEARRFHRLYGAYRIDLETAAEDADARNSLPLGSYLRWVIEIYVLSQTLQIALDKAAQKQYRFFLARDVDGFRIAKPVNATAYIQYDEPRVSASYGLLKQLGLLDRAEGYHITHLGREVLDKARTYHASLAHDVQGSASATEVG